MNTYIRMYSKDLQEWCGFDSGAVAHGAVRKAVGRRAVVFDRQSVRAVSFFGGTSERRELVSEKSSSVGVSKVTVGERKRVRILSETGVIQFAGAEKNLIH